MNCNWSNSFILLRNVFLTNISDQSNMKIASWYRCLHGSGIEEWAAQHVPRPRQLTSTNAPDARQYYSKGNNVRQERIMIGNGEQRRNIMMGPN